MKVKLHSSLNINNKSYPAGSEISWFLIYPFFFVHMLMFGLSGFFMAYSPSNPPTFFLFMHGGIAILVYIIFYFAIFGPDTVKWMFINAALGFFGIFAEIKWILALFGKSPEHYPWYTHIVPFLYYILYTFLIRQAILDFTGARDNPSKASFVNLLYVVISVVIYALIYFSQN